jgi:hypothetical protein
LRKTPASPPPRAADKERSETMNERDDTNRTAHVYDIVDLGGQWVVYLDDYTPGSEDDFATVASFDTEAEAKAAVTIWKLIDDGYLRRLENGHLVHVALEKCIERDAAWAAKNALRRARNPPSDDDLPL